MRTCVEVRNKVLPLLQYILSTGHACSSGRVSQNSEAPQLWPDGRVAAHPLLGSRARLAHTQALTLLQLLRVLLERVAEGPEGLALRVELDLDLLGDAGWRPGRTVGATGLQPTAHSGEGGSRARPARAARPPRRAPARRRRCPRRSRAACARRSAPWRGETVCGGDGGVQGRDDRLEAPGVALRASFGLLWGVRGEGRTRIRHRVPGLRPGCQVYRWGFGLAFGVQAPCTQRRRG